MGTKNGRRKALHAKRKGPNTPPCFTHDCIAPGGLWQGLNRLLKVEAAGLMLPHSTFPVTPERQGTLSHGPLCHCGLSPSHHSGSTLQAAAIFVLQSRAGPSGCRPHVASVVAARRGAWLVGTRLLSQCCCSQPSKLAPRGYQLLTS